MFASGGTATALGVRWLLAITTIPMVTLYQRNVPIRPQERPPVFIFQISLLSSPLWSEDLRESNTPDACEAALSVPLGRVSSPPSQRRIPFASQIATYQRPRLQRRTLWPGQTLAISEADQNAPMISGNEPETTAAAGNFRILPVDRGHALPD
jgi:hypothetical protein